MKASAYGVLLLISAILAVLFWERIAPYLFHCTDPALFDSDILPPFMHPANADKYFFPQSFATAIWVLVFGATLLIPTIVVWLSRSGTKLKNVL
jgi:hypothetical protein